MANNATMKGGTYFPITAKVRAGLGLRWLSVQIAAGGNSEQAPSAPWLACAMRQRSQVGGLGCWVGLLTI